MSKKTNIKKSSHSDFYYILDKVRGKTHYREFSDILLTYVAARMIDKNDNDHLFQKEYVSLTEINSYLISKDREILTYSERVTKLSDDIQITLFDYVKKIDIDDILDHFYFIHSSKTIDPIDLNLSNFEDIINFKGCKKIAETNCRGSSLMQLGAINSNYKGEFYLFSKYPFYLKMSFVNLYPISQKIYLHHEDFGYYENTNDKFDFIIVNPPFGARPEREILSPITRSNRIELIHSEKALTMLKKEGKALFVLPYNTFFSEVQSHRSFREYLLKNYEIDFISRIRDSKRPVNIGLILLRNIQPSNKKVLVGILNEQQIFDFVEGYIEFVKNGDIKAIYSPPIFTVEKEKLAYNFALDGLTPIYQDNLKKVEQKGFELIELEKLCRIIPGTAGIKSVDYHKEKSKNLVPYLRIQDIQNNKVVEDNLVFIGQDIARRPNFTISNDILISVTGTIGKAGLINKESENMLVSRSLCILRPDTRLIDPNFLMAMLSSNFVIFQLQYLKTGEYIEHLSLANLKKLKIPVLAVEEQRGIVNEIKNLDKKLSKLQEEEQKIRVEKKNILDKLVG